MTPGIPLARGRVRDGKAQGTVVRVLANMGVLDARSPSSGRKPCRRHRACGYRTNAQAKMGRKRGLRSRLPGVSGGWGKEDCRCPGLSRCNQSTSSINVPGLRNKFSAQVSMELRTALAHKVRSRRHEERAPAFQHRFRYLILAS